jgi:hypothetical protein
MRLDPCTGGWAQAESVSSLCKPLQSVTVRLRCHVHWAVFLFHSCAENDLRGVGPSVKTHKCVVESGTGTGTGDRKVLIRKAVLSPLHWLISRSGTSSLLLSNPPDENNKLTCRTGLTPMANAPSAGSLFWVWRYGSASTMPAFRRDK